jgi:glycosyltransferase involved in cell wall biosynthesis
MWSEELKTAVVIPAYNEASSIAGVVRGVAPYGTPIVVEDHCTDGTGDIAESAGAVVVRHTVTKGYDGAIQSGFEQAAAMGKDLVATIDGDGQHDPALLSRILDPIQRGEADLVLGIRPSPARLAERLFDLYTKVRFGVPDILCGLKAYRMTLYHEHGCFDRYGSIGTSLALYGLRKKVSFTMVKIPIRPRIGKSRFGIHLGADYRIFRAMVLAILTDAKRGARG